MRGALLPESLTHSARIGLFLTHGLHEQAPDAREIKNPVLKRTGLLVVDYTIEISNLELIQDTIKMFAFINDSEGLTNRIN